ncbi:AAA family ATPase [Pseudolysinimonas kribbensis]|uniref:AAA family ATPase n=1 Tax=Pseudolysinimonas kribbensis TaxID=433641 RepID=UPI0024E05678|nr:AAA family ATPase [Pseudolysinimonas kribbensis]
MTSLAELLSRPAEPLARVEGLMPWEAGMLLIAERKAGKSTVAIGASRSLITGQPFLGTLAVRPIEPGARVAYLNFEVSAATFARWASDARVPADRLIVASLRGRPTPFANDHELRHLGELLRDRNVESLIIDPFSRAFDGADQNSNSEVSRFLDRLDAWARTVVGARDVILLAHSGHLGEHVRGASAMEGWADVNVWLTRQGATRYLRAEGRDVDLPEAALTFDPATRLLTFSGAGSRRDAAHSDGLDRILRFLRDAAVPMSGRQIHDALDDMLGDHGVRDALAYGKRMGRLDWVKGPRNSQLWSIPVMPTFSNGGSGDASD